MLTLQKMISYGVRILCSGDIVFQMRLVEPVPGAGGVEILYLSKFSRKSPTLTS